MPRDSAREMDENGFITIESNPISRVGVFPYLARMVDASADPDKIVYVYRPAQELEDPECIESFKLIPFIDGHVMLGSTGEGYMPAEKKGVHGTTGANVDFKDGVLYSDLRIFSETLANLINSGKKDLSLGYRCRYEKAPGIFAGQSYDYVQRSLRGNHLALVDQARCDVAVLDNMTFDRFDLNLEKEKMPATLDELDAKIVAQDAKLDKLTTALDTLVAKIAADEKEDDKDDKDKKAEDADMEVEGGEKKKAEDDEDDEDKEKDKKAMDSKMAAMDAEIQTLKKGGIKAMVAEVSARDALASRLTKLVGTFDHSDKTADEVAAYGVEKLGIKCEKGHERTAVDFYLQGREVAGPEKVASMDQSTGQPSDKIASFYTPKS